MHPFRNQPGCCGVDRGGKGDAAMKRQLCGLMLTGILATSVMLAQGPNSGSASGTPPDSSEPLSHQAAARSKKLDKQLAHMSKRYKLTADQQAQVKTILTKEQQDMQTLSADTYLSAGNRRDEAAALDEASQQKIGAILTTKQKHKFDADEKRRAWMDGRLPEPNPGPALNSSW
jgi:Spy/CpxP family protein refolding chaperone